MSELKAFDITVAEEYYCEGIVKYRRAVYDKSEADEVIAEKDKEIAELKKENEYTIECTTEVINAQEREIRHQKYKRCLKMARWCASRAVVWDIDGNEKKSDWYWKWKERWKELAEKFKPNNKE